MIYTIEYWKCGLPHKTVKRKANNISSIPNIDLILSTAYKMNIYDCNGNLVATWQTD